MADRSNLDDLIAAHEERLGLLRVQAARQGDDTPPHTISEIGRIEGELAQLKQAAAYPVSPALVEELGPTGRYQLWMSHIMRLDADIGRVRADLAALRGHIDERLDTLLLAVLQSRPADAAQPPRRHTPVRVVPKAKR